MQEVDSFSPVIDLGYHYHAIDIEFNLVCVLQHT